MVKKETQTKDYPFVCTKCDENLYYFETTPVRNLKK
jgi:transcription initiation factor IIE alpha subunit